MITRRSLLAAPAILIPGRALGWRRGIQAQPPNVYFFSKYKFPRARAAFANFQAGSANFVCACLGDSTTLGTGSASNPLEAINSYPVKLAAALNSAFGWNTVSETIFGGGNSNPLSAFDNRVVMGSGWTNLAGGTGPETIGGKLFEGTGTGTLSFTPTTPCDTFMMPYATSATGGQLDLNLDGGASLLTLNTNGANGYAVATVTGALGMHTLNVVQSSGSAALVGGFNCYNSAKKTFQVWNWGWAGSQASDWTATNNPWSAVNAIPFLAPNLVISFGPIINSWNGGDSVSTWSAAMATLLVAVLQTSDVLLVSPPPSSIADSSLATQQTYITALYKLAAQYGLPLFDLWQQWGSYETFNPYGYYHDDKHPNANGYSAAGAPSIVNNLVSILGQALN